MAAQLHKDRVSLRCWCQASGFDVAGAFSCRAARIARLMAKILIEESERTVVRTIWSGALSLEVVTGVRPKTAIIHLRT